MSGLRAAGRGPKREQQEDDSGGGVHPIGDLERLMRTFGEDVMMSTSLLSAAATEPHRPQAQRQQLTVSPPSRDTSIFSTSPNLDFFTSPISNAFTSPPASHMLELLQFMPSPTALWMTSLPSDHHPSDDLIDHQLPATPSTTVAAAEVATFLQPHQYVGDPLPAYPWFSHQLAADPNAVPLANMDNNPQGFVNPNFSHSTSGVDDATSLLRATSTFDSSPIPSPSRGLNSAVSTRPCTPTTSSMSSDQSCSDNAAEELDHEVAMTSGGPRHLQAATHAAGGSAKRKTPDRALNETAEIGQSPNLKKP